MSPHHFLFCLRPGVGAPRPCASGLQPPAPERGRSPAVLHARPPPRAPLRGCFTGSLWGLAARGRGRAQHGLADPAAAPLAARCCCTMSRGFPPASVPPAGAPRASRGTQGAAGAPRLLARTRPGCAATASAAPGRLTTRGPLAGVTRGCPRLCRARHSPRHPPGGAGTRRFPAPRASPAGRADTRGPLLPPFRLYKAGSAVPPPRPRGPAAFFCLVWAEPGRAAPPRALAARPPPGPRCGQVPAEPS